MKTGTVYRIKNTINESIYIGSTTRKLNERMREHKSRAKTRSKEGELYDDMNLLGAENFFIEAIKCNIPQSELIIEEYKCIKENTDKCYNTLLGMHITKADEISQLYLNGKTIKQIAEMFGACKKTISQTLIANNVEIKDWNDQQRFKESPEAIERLYTTEGMTSVEIGKLYNVSNVTVLNLLKRHGVPIRKAVNRKYL